MILAYFFPQFHEFQENNEFWGKGFTDFSNVARSLESEYGYPVIRPYERMGFYDLLWHDQRMYQAAIAKKYDVHGFIIMHYWFDGKPVMDKPLEALLVDGQPDIPFCLMWANEHWTKRWDGSDGSEVLLRQTYNAVDAKPHFEWMKRFFFLKNYILVDNKPMLVIYRASEIAELKTMLIAWRDYAVAAGFAGLHVVQNNGGRWTEDAHELQQGVDAIAEYLPHMFNRAGLSWPTREVSPLHTLS